jgi:hypothetical protein|tara:strand:+ start:7406 stop:7801 length:396 start_codon:yes stop_codon:yes gene_type:complete
MSDAGILEAISRLEKTIEPSAALEARVAELERSAARAEGRAEGAGPPVTAATVAALVARLDAVEGGAATDARVVELILRHSPRPVSWQKLITAVAALVVPIVLALLGQDAPASALDSEDGAEPVHDEHPGE